VNFNPLYPLLEEEAGDLAACLLSASAIEIYHRCLEQAGATQRLRAALVAGAVDGKDLLRWSWFHRARILETPRRTEWELPLASMLFVLGESGVANVDKLLSALATAQQPQLGWLAGLSRRLLANRRSVQLEAGAPAAPQVLTGIGLQTSALATLPPSKMRTSGGWARHLLVAA